MDFFEHQHRARKRTGLLIAYFICGVIGTILAVYFVIAFAYLFMEAPSDVEFTSWLSQNGDKLWDWPLLIFVAGGTVAIVFIGSAVKLAELSCGGRAIATSLGGRQINTRPTDLNEQRLYNVVEEMAIASGVPMPELYIMDQESGINAFAAGYSPSDAAIGVTRGTVEKLTRDELQGVIAHEFSHILNGDMRLNTRLIAILAGILGIAVVGRVAMEFGMRAGFYSRGGNDSKNNALPLIVMAVGVAVLIIGSIGMLFGRMIKAAISRQREYLADASAVQFTRNPLGIIGALDKIRTSGSKIQNPHAEEASHMFFANGLNSFLAQAFATHPPLLERINRIDPSGAAERESETRESTDATARSVSPVEQFFAEDGPIGHLVNKAQIAAGESAPPLNAPANEPAGQMVDSAGQSHLQYVKRVMGNVPAEVTEAAHEPVTAAALIYALLLSSDTATRQVQIGMIGELHPAIRQETARLAEPVSRIAPAHRLTIVDVAIPALRELSARQYNIFRRKMEALAGADQAIDLFEFALERVVTRHLDRSFGLRQDPKVKYRSLDPLINDALVLVSALAHVGQDGDAVKHAFEKGATQLAARGGPFKLLPFESCGLSQISEALDRIALATPLIKRNALYACAMTVTASGKVNAHEAELVRAIAESFDSPLPPFIAHLEHE